MVLDEGQVAPQAEVLRGDEMRTPDEVAAMLRLKALGWGIRRIARELGCSHMTVRRYVAEGGYVVFRRPVGRPRALAGLDAWVAEWFRRHAGNADVVRQELLAEKGIALSLRTVEREVAPLRRDLAAEARATNAASVPLGELVLGHGGQEARGGPAFLVGLFGELRPDDLDGRKAQVAQHDAKTCGIDRGGGLHAASPIVSAPRSCS